MSPLPADSLYLIDGYALIYRAFFAMIGRPLTTSRGENTSAAWGVANFLFRLLDERHPRYAAWVNDRGTSFRHETFPEYKATREKLDAELQEDFDRSVDRIREILDAFGIPLVEVEGYEADDVIGTLAEKAKSAGIPSVIVSGDKDFYQLISPSVCLLNPGRGGPAAVEEVVVNIENASERLGVPPERVVDYLALVGDSSDNVPGVKGVGDKTARTLIETYGSLDRILEHAEEVKAKRAREALIAYRDNALLSRELVTIRRDVPVELELNRLELQEPDRERLARIFNELEFNTLVAKLGQATAGGDEAAGKEPSFVVVDDVKVLERAIGELEAAGEVVLHVPSSGGMAGVALSSSGRTYYFPQAHRTPDGELLEQEVPRNLPPLSDPAMERLRRLLASRSVGKTGHDLKSALLELREHGVELGGLRMDTMLASYVLEPGKRSYLLSLLVLEKLGLKLELPDEQAKARGKSTPLIEQPTPAVARTEAMRAQAISSYRRVMEQELEAQHLTDLLQRVEMPLIEVLSDMEWRGIAVDVAALRELSREFTRELRELEGKIHQAAGCDFNINSTQQLRHILFEKLNLPIIKKTKTGPSTDADVLQQLSEMGYDVPDLLLEYRELTKLKTTYVDVLPNAINARTGRIHTRFNQVGAATGRLSSSDPNLQNIPIRTSRGERIRKCFVPGEGMVFVVADYSQVELRVLAHLSNDPLFVAAFEEGADIHRQTASVIFDVPLEEVTPVMRAQAKTINFATIYGQGAFALSKQLRISQAESKEFIDTYFKRFSGVRRFLDETIESAKRRGYVETILGRRRYIPELKDKNRNIRAFGERTAMNSPIQGSAADLIKLAMINLHRSLGVHHTQAAILLQVHDELIVEAPAAEADSVRELVKSEMEGVYDLKVPLTVDVGVGPNWLDAKA